MRKFTLLTAVAMIGLFGPAGAQGANITLPSDQVIAARQGGMSLTSGNLAAMKGVVDSGAEVKPLAESAKALAKWGRIYPELFPDGTQTGNNTKARPEIWSDRAGFQKAADALVQTSDKLAQLAEAGDKAGVAAAFKDLGGTCGGCHRSYRAR